MNKISSLLYRHILGRKSKNDSELLNNWATGNDTAKDILINLADDDFIAKDMKCRSMVSYERPMTDMMFRIKAIRRRKRITILSWTTAAVLFIGIVASPFYFHHSLQQKVIAQADSMTDSISSFTLESIKPGMAVATLHTANGEVLPLSASDTLPVNMATLINQRILANDNVVEQLSLEVPRGAEFKVVLEDSTSVWLNSQSSLVYPEVFGSKERRVQLIGEAFFEVMTDSLRPFIVDAGSQTVRVYGTSFNVRAYADEPSISTTLESGLISIARADIPSGEIKIRPGHQAKFNKVDKKLLVKQVDPEVITSWRHGYFVFEEQPLSYIMQDLSRWYNFEYEIPDEETAQMVFMGSIPRYSDFKTAISILEKIGNLNFSTKGDKILVSKNL